MEARDADTGQGMTDKQLRNEVATMMFAGHETTSVALTWAFYLLSQNPAVEAQLQAELDRVLAGRAPALSDLPNLPYTRAVIEETLRLYPPAFGVNRQSIAEDTFGDYRVPANASITLMLYNAHHDPRFWTEPDRFDPARFSPERSADRPPFAYLPFGAGPRLCIGNQFALTEAQLVLATIAQRYQLRLTPGHPVRPNVSFLLRTSDGLPMTARRRS
jgi:cytochrome P450